MIVVADTTPLNYLVLIGHQDVLRQLYGRVIAPGAVEVELKNADAPAAVRAWIERPPSWLEIRTPGDLHPDELSNLDPGEREALALAAQLGADLVLLDESLARREATRRHLNTIGTLGVLREASIQGLLVLPQAIELLQRTTFHVRPTLLEELLEEHRQRHSQS